MIHKYKATIEGNKVFMREYEIQGEISLYALHRFLQNDLGFAPDQMVLFRGCDSKGKCCSEYALFDMGDGAMDSVKIDTVLEKGECRIKYVYDPTKGRSIAMDYLGSEERSVRCSYPRLVAERGKNPDQFSDLYDDFEQLFEPEQEISDGEEIEL